MNELKKLLVCALGLTVAFTVVACDVDDEDGAECDDSGVCGAGGAGGAGGAPGMGGMGGTPMGAEYKYVIIVDNSADENMQGTPGADICGVIAECDGVESTATSAEITVGQGLVCDGSTTEPPCESGTNRQDAAAARDRGDNCEPGSSPSDYASLGLSGELALGFATDLQGCSVTITELTGNDVEGYDVYVCQTAVLDAATCIGGAVLQSADMGGAISVAVPAAQ